MAQGSIFEPSQPLLSMGGECPPLAEPQMPHAGMSDCDEPSARPERAKGVIHALAFQSPDRSGININ